MSEPAVVEAPLRVDVTFSPPTPNGDFHLGHLSGPVLSSDVCARAQRLLGADTAFATSTDDNQTYVVTTAARMGIDPHALIDSAVRAMSDSLALADVDVDLFCRTDETYQSFTRDFFTTVWKAGGFDRIEVSLPWDEDAQTFRAEAFVTGRCPTCLAVARAGVCEACGLYNLPDSLLVDDAERALPRRPVQIWALDLERHRDRLEKHFEATMRFARPNLRRVISESLAARLPYIPITYPIDWGIDVAWDGPTEPAQAINAWPEIFVGHVYWLRQARGDRKAAHELVQFIGIDNGFYNAFVYPTLAMLATDAGLIDAMPRVRTLTNEYYLLEGRKFSTSKGDVRWAGEFLRDAGRDRARFVLCLTSPELQKAEFSDSVALSTLADRFDAPLAAIEAALRPLVGREVDAAASGWWQAAAQASVRRFARAYALDTFSVRDAAEAVAIHLETFAARLAVTDLDRPEEAAGARSFLWALATAASPVTPDLCAAIRRAFGAAAERADPPRLAAATDAPHSPLLDSQFARSGTSRGDAVDTVDTVDTVQLVST